MKKASNTSASSKSIRCAIYTRKSTEEGLQQEFNTLDAQCESGERRGPSRYRLEAHWRGQRLENEARIRPSKISQADYE